MRIRASLYIGLPFLLLLASCFKDDNFSYKSGTVGSETVKAPQRVPSEESRHVLLLYSAGFNSLSVDLEQDVVDLENGYLPSKDLRSDPVFLVYSRRTYADRNYSTKMPSVLFRLYADKDGKPHRDTLQTWSKSKDACSPATMESVLNYVKDAFPAKSYGMIFSSHGTGWLPAEYYNNPSAYERDHAGDLVQAGKYALRRAIWQEEFPELEPFPAVKSLGQDLYTSSSVEMDIRDFANAIPFKLDYILFDACLAGGVELAYQLRGKADLLGFSPTEILADGLYYLKMGSRLLKGDPDPLAVCQDFYEYYDGLSDSYRSATISFVDTRKMEALATVCGQLFQQYRETLQTMNGSGVQRYYRSDRHFFYDLQDILVKAGITAQEQQALEDALSQCVLYKAATPQFLGITMKNVCGFSMYLPSRGSALLDQFYRNNMAWNDATHLVP